MKQSNPQSTPGSARVFVACLLSFAILITPIAAISAPRARTNRTVKENSVPTERKDAIEASEARDLVPAPVPEPAPAAPIIVATMTDNRPSVDPASAKPGETINYTVTIQNTGDADATSVQFNDDIDLHTAYVNGSGLLTMADTYNTIGDVNISIAAPGLLTNDLDISAGNNTGMTATAQTISSAQCAACNNVTINADGSFTYDPKAGFSGTDSFTYTAHNAANTRTANATVQITVTGRVWFINNNAGACTSNCDGRLSHPFQTLAAFQAVNDGGAGHPQDGDVIFLFENTAATAYTGPVTLRTNQKFIGQDATASLISLSGFTQPSGTDPLPAMNSGNGNIVNIQSGSNAINLGSGNMLRGFTVGATTGTKISGTSFGTLTVGNNTTPDVTLNGNGQALNLATGAFAATSGFVSVATTSSGTQGINLSAVTGTASFGSTAVSGNASQCILIGGTTADINFGNTSCTGGTDGVSFQNNANVGHVLTFGTLSVSGGSGNAFSHSVGGGNVTVTGAATLSSAGSAVLVNAPTNTNVINFQAATSATSTGAGNAGVSWVGTAGATITFNSLTIQTNGGTGLNATTGGTVNVTNATGTVNNTVQAASAIVASGIALNANFSAIKSSGGANGVSLTSVTGTSSFGSSSTLSGATGATFLVSGGTASVTYSGGITQATASQPTVQISGGHSTGTITFNTGTLSATNGTGLQFDNADGIYNFNGTSTLAGGDAGIDILNGSAGTFSFSSNTSITNPTGTCFTANGSTAGVTYSGNLTKNAASPGLLVDITNESSGTITFQTGTLSSTSTAGTGIQLSNADNTVNFNGTTTLNGGNAGVDIITGCAGTITFASGTAITNPSGVAYNEDTSTANVTYGGTISQSNAASAVKINAKTGGTTAFNKATGGQITASTTTQNAVDLTNTGGTVTFAGGLSLTTTSGICFNASGSGATVNATQDNSTIVNTITSTTGAGLSVVNSTIGASGLTFRSINVDGNDVLPTNGIVLNSTGSSGGLTVTGTGSAGTGGTIQDTSGNAIQLTTTQKLSLSWMNITSNLGSGIGGSGINGFQLDHCSLTANGDSAAADESGINVTQLTGTASAGARPTSITNCTIQNNFEFQIQIVNSSGTLTDLTMSGNTISNTAPAVSANLFNFLGNGTASMKLTVTSGTFTGDWTPASPVPGPAVISGTAIAAVTQGTGGHTVNVSGATFTNNNAGVDCSTTNVATTFSCNVSNNNFQGTRAIAINSFHNGNAPFNRTFNGTFSNNTIGTIGTAISGSYNGRGIDVSNEGAITTATYTISNNQIREVGVLGTAGAEGIGVNVGLGGQATGGGSTNVTITGNTIRDIRNSRGLIVSDNQDPALAPFPTICANISGNTFTGVIAGQAGNGQYMRIKEGSGTVNVTQAMATGAAVAGQLDDANGFNDVTKISIGGTPQYSQPACTLSMARLFESSAPTQDVLARADLSQATIEATATVHTARGDFAKATIGAAATVHTEPNRSEASPSFANLFTGAAHSLATLAGTVDSLIVPTAYAESKVRDQKSEIRGQRSEVKLNHASGRRSTKVTTTTRVLSPVPFAPCGAITPTHICVDVGTLHPGDSVQISFSVTVNNPPNLSLLNPARVTTQGSVTGVGFAAISTDDPDVGGANDSTSTPIDLFDVSVGLGSSLNPSTPTDPVTYTATITIDTAVQTPPGGTVPTGSVTFKDNNVAIGTCMNVALTGAGPWTAQCTIAGGTYTGGSSHPITATYNGDGNFDTKTSSTLTQNVVACGSNPVVTKIADTNDGVCDADCSLREAIATVCNGGTITFDTAGVFATPQTITLGGAELSVDKNVTINGPSPVGQRVTVSGNNASRVFNINASKTVTISNLNITGGSASTGGGVLNSGTVTLKGATLSGNASTVDGGAITNDGVLTVVNSTFSGNSAGADGGGISHTASGSTLTLINTTVSGNNAAGSGGGVIVLGGTMTSINSTFTNNRADSDNNALGTGGAIRKHAGIATLHNTIVAGNFNEDGVTDAPDDISGTVEAASSFNLIGDAATAGGLTNGTNGNIVGNGGSGTINIATVLNTALANNGGPTQTHKLVIGGPAIDAGNNANLPADTFDLDGDANTAETLPVDQRGPGFDRIVDGDQNATATVDIGAYESVPPPPAPNAPDLDDASDTGPSNSDNYTSDNTPTFTISGVTIGATVELLLDGTPVASGVAAGVSIQLTSTTVSDGMHTFAARQTVAGETSANSAGLGVTIDTTAPAAPTIDLQAGSDTGTSNTDNTTNATTRTFDIGNTEVGATVELLRDGNPISSLVSGGGTVQLSDSTAFVSGTTYAYTARQTDKSSLSATSLAVNVLIDSTAPTVSSSVRVDANPTNAASVIFTVTFSENVAGVDTGDFALTTTGSVSGASVTNVTGSNNTRTVTVNTGTGDGTVRLDVSDNDSITDIAGNPLGGPGAGNGNFTGGETYTVSKSAPTADITDVTPDPRNTSVSSITIVFSKAVTGFDLSDLSLTRNGGANLLTGAQTLNTGDNVTFTLGNLSGLTGTEGTYVLTLTAAGSGITDSASNALSGNASDTWVMDITGPTVTINQAASQTDPGSGSTINFTVVFNEPVTGFDSTDVMFSGAGATTAMVTEIAPNNGTTYNVAISGMNAAGTVTATVPAGAAQDAAGNNSAASTSVDNTVTYVLCTMTPIVTTNADSGAGSLRQAIADACDGATITFNMVVSPITLTSGQLVIDKNLTITGPGANLLSVMRSTAGGTPQFRIFNINSGKTVTISGLTLNNGNMNGDGGGVLNQGTLTLTDCALTGNTSSGQGGGVTNATGGTMTITGSTISGNTGVVGGGGITNAGTLTLINSTISGNTGDGLSNGTGAVANLTNGTFSNNSIRGITSNPGATTNVRNTIVVHTPGAFGDVQGNFVSQGNNLIGKGDGSAGLTNGVNNDQVGTIASPLNAFLAALGNYGGPTQTHALLPGSRAINTGNNCVTDVAHCGDANIPQLTTDQRGLGRQVNGTVDIGAFESRGFTIAATSGTPQSAVFNTAFGAPLVATVSSAFGEPVSGGQVTFTAPGAGASATFTGGVTTIGATINGIGQASALATANATVGGPYNVTASGLGITGAANFSLTNTKADQTITFGAIANKTFGDPDFLVIATASSGLPVTLVASGQCTVSSPAPGSVHLTGAGGCTITASQPGNGNYNPAPSVPQSFSIAKPATSTLVSSNFNPSDFNQSVTFRADVSSVGPMTGTVQFKDNGNNLGAPVALDNLGVALFTTSSLTAGTHTITAEYSGDANFLASTGTLTGGQVVKAQPSLSINDVSITEGDAGTKVLTFTVTLSAGSNLPVSVNYATANGTATAGSDYVATNGSFTFNPLDNDVTRTVNVTINGDVSFEPDETFTVTLTNPLNATISKAVGTGTIQNDDAQGGIISFSQANTNVNESTGIVTLTVVRTNDVTQAANVDYATDDTGASTNCAALNTGLASQRCDYTSVFGTLKFAANETQKTIDVPINLDAYTEGAETFTVKLSNPTGGAVLAAPFTATVTINDSASPTPNAIDDTTNFVRQQYRDFLNREADPTGLAFWVDNIDKCNDPARRPAGQTLAQCIEVQRITTSAAFFLSIEFKQTGGLVREFYVAALDRPATNNMPNFVEFMRDTQGIQKGVVVGQGNWQQVLDANRMAFMNDFVTRAEFVALYPTTDTPAQYVDKLYLHAAVMPGSPQERLDAIAEFGGAPTAADAGARGRALLRITQNAAFQAREMNRTFVQIEYFGYLRRNPNDAPDNNFNGFNFWVNKLNQFNGDYLQAEMVKAFLSSLEYRSRFGP